MESDIFKSKPPSRITGARRLKMGATGWGALQYYHVEFVKLNKYKGKTRPSALIKVNDVSGKVILFFEGDLVSKLFDLSPSEWDSIKQLASSTNELFYRHFRNGLTGNFSIEQQIFYAFCKSCFYRDLLFVSFERSPNTRKGEKSIAFLKVIDCVKPNPILLDLYYKIK